MTRARRPILLRIFNVFAIVMVVILVLFGIASWIVYQKKNDLLLDEIQSYVQASQSGQLEVSGIDLRIFKNFPNITLELKGIRYYERIDSVREESEQPIVSAEHLFVAVELVPLLNDEVKISRVTLSDAKVDIVEYPDGKLNIEMALARPKATPPPVKKDTATTKATKPAAAKSGPKPTTADSSKAVVAINLHSLSLTDVAITWLGKNKSPATVIMVDQLKSKLDVDGNVLTFELTTSSDVRSLYMGKTPVPPGELKLDARILFDLQSQALTILQSEVRYDEFSATLNGKYAPKDSSQIDMDFDASSNDLELLSLVIKPEVLRQNPDLLKRGDIYIKGSVSGALSTPVIDVSFGMKDLALRLPRELGTFNDVAFEGSFNSGTAPKYSGATLEIDKISGELPGGFIKGNFSVHNFVNPYLKYDFAAQLKVDGYDQVFNISAIKQLKGLVSVQANFDGPLTLFDQHQSDSSRSSTIKLDSVSFILAKTNLPVSGLSGVMENKNNRATIKDLAFRYGRNNLSVNATIDNFVYLLFKRSTAVVVDGKIRSSQLYTRDFIMDTTLNARIQDRINDLSLDFQATTSGKDSTQAIPNIEFSILNLTANLDKLPDINTVNAKGTFRDSEQGLRLDLKEFHATMPQGKLDVVGDLLIPGRRRLEFNAQLQGDKFPVHYVQELITEIKSHDSGKANKTVEQMNLVTTKLDISAEMITRPFALTKLIVRDTKFDVLLADKRSFSASKLNVNCSDLTLNYAKDPGTGLKSTKGTVSMKQLQIPGLGLMDLDLDITGKNDSMSIDFSRGVPETKLEEGNLFVDFSKPVRSYDLNYIVKGAKLENYIQKFAKEELMKGEVDYEVDLTASGSTMASLKQTMAGTIEINGDSLDIYGVNVDKILRKFERSQHFNLTDLGAVLVAGPVGLAVTKGTDFVSLATIKLKPGDHTFLNELRTKWSLKDLQLTTEDVAFATLENRIALIGAIDLGRDSIPSLNIAVIDKNGCALMEQELYGKMSDLKTGKIKIARTLLGSVINFGNKVVGKDCKPVYTGTVQAPKEPEGPIKRLTN